MKKLLLFAAAFILFNAESSAQYCGGSGPSVCTATGTFTGRGLEPSEDISCIVRTTPTDMNIQFKNFDTLVFGSQSVTVQSLRFDTISNLPAGLCWKTSSTDNTFTNQQDGCINISGTTFDAPGQYKLNIVITFNIGFDIQTNADAAGMKTFLRVIEPGVSVCPMVDTNQTSLYSTANNYQMNTADVTGRVFIDANQNGVYDVGERGIANQFVNTTQYTALTNGSGVYHMYVPAGNYSLSAALSNPNFTNTVSSINVQADSIAVTYSGNDFPVQIPASYCEGHLNLVANGPPARPGFICEYLAVFQNQYSANPVNQDFRLYYDTIQTYISSLPAPSVIDTVNHYLEWHSLGLSAGGMWYAHVEFYTPQTVPLNTVLNYSLQSLNSSCADLDSIFNYQTTVVGSYDPNDKSVSPVGYTVNHGINPNLTNELTYLVRFQNTGTFMAENITVIDTLSDNVDVSSLKVLSASADYEVQINGHTVKFVFKNINLPDSTSNEPMSHGYVQYSVKPNASLPQDVVIDNLADIYFDYNTPIRTNTATSTIDYTVVSGIAEVAKAQYTFALRPNPTTGALQITIDKELLGKQLILTDVSGRILVSKKADAITDNINLSNYASGIYFVKVDAAVKRLVKQ